MIKIILILFSFLFCQTCSGYQEKKLANININMSYKNVLEKFGDPNEIHLQNYSSMPVELSYNFGKLQSEMNDFDQITWLYLKRTYNLKITFNSQNAVSIIVIDGKSSPYKTERNISLGSLYSDILKSYGMPTHEYNNDYYITLHYKQKNISFQVIKNNSNFKSTYLVNMIEIKNTEN